MTAIAPAELAANTLHRRAVEAAIWGMPLASVDAMREAYFRDAGAAYNDIVYWSRPSDWKFQFTTPNASTYYVYFNVNTRGGPVVVDIPAVGRAGLFGSIVDGWEFPLTDVGPEGRDGGRGGCYLLLPPGYQGNIPGSCFVLPMHTYNGYALFRAIARSRQPEDIADALALIKGLKVHPLSEAKAPAPQRYIDMAGKLMDGVVAFDDGFYDRLARMVDEEPVQQRDLVAMGQLRSLGIGKDLEFHPGPETRRALAEAAGEAHQVLMQGAAAVVPYWPKAHWGMSVKVGPNTGFSYMTPDRLEIDERGMLFFLAFAAPATLGAATFYLGCWRDSGGELLQGGRSYRLHVPPDVPVKQYWALTLYDAESCCFIRGLPRPGLDFLRPGDAPQRRRLGRHPRRPAPAARARRPTGSPRTRTGNGSPSSASTAPTRPCSARPGHSATSNGWPDMKRLHRPLLIVWLGLVAPAPVWAAAAAPQASRCCQAMAGTQVEVELTEDVSTKVQKTGDAFTFRLTKPLVVDGFVTVPAGATGQGVVLEATKPGLGGKGAKLVLSARYLVQGGAPDSPARPAAGGHRQGPQRRGQRRRHGRHRLRPAGSRRHGHQGRRRDGAQGHGRRRQAGRRRDASAPGTSACRNALLACPRPPPLRRSASRRPPRARVRSCSSARSR
ncbi:MAG: DUF1254 domain-containing protein [Caulobacteraceae bacterium]